VNKIMDIFTKITETSIKVTRTSEPIVTDSVYDYDSLVKQKEDIQAMKDKDNAVRDAEIKEVSDLLAQFAKLGITAEPTEEPII